MRRSAGALYGSRWPLLRHQEKMESARVRCFAEINADSHAKREIPRGGMEHITIFWQTTRTMEGRKLALVAED